MSSAAKLERPNLVPVGHVTRALLPAILGYAVGILTLRPGLRLSPLAIVAEYTWALVSVPMTVLGGFALAKAATQWWMRGGNGRSLWMHLAAEVRDVGDADWRGTPRVLALKWLVYKTYLGIVLASFQIVAPPSDIADFGSPLYVFLRPTSYDEFRFLHIAGWIGVIVAIANAVDYGTRPPDTSSTTGAQTSTDSPS